MNSPHKLHVAVVGGGVAGLSAAWLLARNHRVTLLERDDRLGGHACTVDAPGADGAAPVPIDTGFIVYNEPCYPNLVRWFDALGVATAPSEMSFAVSREGGGFEYAGGPPLGLLAQPSLLLRRRFWSMLGGLLRFYRQARLHPPADESVTLGQYLEWEGYSRAFVEDHLMPFASAIWSSPSGTMLDYPAAAFIRFCDNHGLLKLTGRPAWRTVAGGSRRYVEAVAGTLGAEAIVTGFETVRVARTDEGVEVQAADGRTLGADHVVLATHADQALACLDAPDALERELLGPFAYTDNLAVLHTDTRFLPARRRAWCSWNYVERPRPAAAGQDVAPGVSVSYWMNRLQPLATEVDHVVTLNPDPLPPVESIVSRARYAHPVFTPETEAARRRLWSLQGRRRTWFCGSYFGAGFHEDALQAGLAVAERLGGATRPWRLDEPSGRIVVDDGAAWAPSGTAGTAPPVPADALASGSNVR